MAHKLLLADDSITIQKVVELVLAEEDFVIKSVSNGEDAFNLLSAFKPDIVLADIEMPKINGYQLCENIKQNPSTAHIPVILLAGAFEPINEGLARKVGADDAVVKPFESQELISKINAVITMSYAGVQEDLQAGILEEGIIEEEALELVEDTEGAIEAEAVEAAVSEEDLWAMEDITEETTDVWPEESAIAKAAVGEGLTVEEPLAIEEEIAVPEPEMAVAGEVIQPQAGKAAVARELITPEIVVPSKEEITAIVKKSIDEKVAAALSTLDLKEPLIASLMPSLKDSIEKILWEIAPELIEKMLKEILKGSIASLTTQVEKVIWETVPDLAGTMISKEIERIKSEF